MYIQLVLSLSSEVQFFTRDSAANLQKKSIIPCAFIGNLQPEG